MTQLIDRRSQGGKNTVNRKRFIQRFKSIIQESIDKKGIQDFLKDTKVGIPQKNLQEPKIGYSSRSPRDYIVAGNKKLVPGDTIRKPPEDKAGGASNTGEGEDDFTFVLTKEELLELYFDSLELPDFVKKAIGKITSTKPKFNGIKTTGVPANINIIRTIKQAKCRKMAFMGKHKRTLRRLNEELEQLDRGDRKDKARVDEIEQEIALTKRRINKIPFIDDVDLRYNSFIKQEIPQTNAVVFFVMDVSGSMTQDRKDLAKRFFNLFNLFLTTKYEKIEVVFIRHHIHAEEVDENEFFYSRQTGGTVVSSGLALVDDLIKARYSPQDYNIYIAQASDGDNWGEDGSYCRELLVGALLPVCQYFCYVEVGGQDHQELWETYSAVSEQFKNLVLGEVAAKEEIYPAFQRFFGKYA